MKSPFPGMDPYIESSGLWEDFHGLLIADVHRALASALPEKDFAQTAVRAYVVLAETDGKGEHAFQSDAAITAPDRPKPQPSAESVAVAEPAADFEPVSLRAFVPTEYREAFIEIYELVPEQRLIICLEVLSPSNKRVNSTGWKQYLRKRQGLLLGEANLVEIDLLRTGTRMPLLDPWPRSPYSLLVARSEQAPRCRVWPAHFQQALPVIPIPLSPPDPDVTLDLQPLVEGVYARSRYHRRIDYTRPLQPPLSDEETAWLAQRLRERASI
jgi:hypothetical protein